MINFNDRWRVRLNDSAQWILEYRAGRPAGAGDGWRGKSYCTQRGTLLRDIRERIIDEGGEVGPEALRQVEALPEKFPYRKAKSRRVEIGRAPDLPDCQRGKKNIASDPYTEPSARIAAE